MPIPNQSQWTTSEFEKLRPPPIRRSVGRPKKLRRKIIDELLDGSCIS